ncbi:MAG: glutamine--tRNA ligase/YqeY domain fusion protein [Saprospiraceae bacterium]|nr:glutamine--tRNA ligase/YqeY domain fusion protein [Saprospiraceae bacterium]
MSHNIKEEDKETLNFIEHIVEEHNKNGRFNQKVHTRFPPEPNGFLHIGHAKAICVSFDLAQKYGGLTNLRFDDTNPSTEKIDFVESIKKDIKWLGFDWEDRLYFTSDYFEQLYEYAVELIKKGKAYVDFSSSETMDEEKKKAIESKYRNTLIESNLLEFKKMKNGVYQDGTCSLRLKIDMQADNWLMRDPVIYRIKHETHHNTGDSWCIYPMYDWAHGLSDSIEKITHSLCSLEFEVHRELYDWCLIQLGVYRPQQIEFSRLNVTYTVTSKRKLKELIDKGVVSGWDDPRMPTISGMRRRGYPPEAIKSFIRRAGVSKRDQYIDLSSLESSVRDELNKTASRVMGVLNPLKVIITNYPEGKTEQLTIINNPEDETKGSRNVPFTREIYIEKEDFTTETPNKKWRRLAVDRNVRFKGAYILTCTGFKTDVNNEVEEVYCTYYPESKSGNDQSGIKPKGTLHWVSIEHAIPAKVNIYDRLFSDENPTGHKDIDFKEFLNPQSLKTISAFVEPGLANVLTGDIFQFMRLGYFCVDPDSKNGKLIFNRTVALKDSWSKKQKGK